MFIMNALHIGNRREFFWDDYLIDRTDGRIVQHEPQYREDVFTCNRAWEGNACSYFSLIQDGDIYRMYYRGGANINDTDTEHLNNIPGVWCYAESRDGIHWERPNLGIYPYRDCAETNIIMGDRFRDNFYIFLDTNPACPPEERFKGLDGVWGEGLKCYVSADGLHFAYKGIITKDGNFDSLNICFWDELHREYRTYLRGAHKNPEGTGESVRDIRLTVSKDFVTWTTPERIMFDEDKEDIHLYTNQIAPYYRGNHIYIGLPVRYVERSWGPSYDSLPGMQRRKKRMNLHPRYGLAITDCLIMTGRDGKYFNRRDEAFWTPGAEGDWNWVYGDCFSCYGMIDVDAPMPGTGKETALFKVRNSWTEPMILERWGIRQDGFFSLKSEYKPTILRTKPFIFDGSKLHLNFSTSVAGGMVFTLITEDGTRYESCEVFGNNTDRTIDFAALPDLSVLAGRPVVLEAVMRDSHLYSMKFE